MDSPDDLQPRLRRRATDALRRLAPAEREALLVKCWMSHDARWFMAVARGGGRGRSGVGARPQDFSNTTR